MMGSHGVDSEGATSIDRELKASVVTNGGRAPALAVLIEDQKHGGSLEVLTIDPIKGGT
jgi:hypothetical protein